MNLNKEIITLRDAIEIYLTWKQSHSEEAYKTYRYRLNGFACYISDQNKSALQEITADDIVNFHNEMMKTFSRATVGYSARILKNFFEFHKGRNNSNINPKEIIPIRFINADKDVVDEEDFEEMTGLLDDRYINDLQKKLVLYLLWQTGMRVSELLGLKMSDINQQGSDGLRTAKVKTRKTQRYNLVVWSKETDELLNQYLGWRILVNHPTDLLFIATAKKRTNDNGLTSRTIQRWVTSLCKEAMIDKNLTPHSFRHGKAHFVLDNGGDIHEVQSILRHRNLNSSLNYIQLNQSKYLQTAGKFLGLPKKSMVMHKGMVMDNDSTSLLKPVLA